MKRLTQPDQLATEPYHSAITKRRLIEWNYRDQAGKLHAGVARDEQQVAEKVEAIKSAAVMP
jgi:hypothetical protein